MEVKTLNLLDILNKSQVLYSTDYSGEYQAPADLLENILENSGSEEPIFNGIMFLQKTSSRSYLVVDGIKRIIQFSLLLHALCECYKLTNEKNNHAIELIKKDIYSLVNIQKFIYMVTKKLSTKNLLNTSV